MSKFALLFVFVFMGVAATAIFYNSAFAFVLYELVYFLNPADRWWGAQLPGVSYAFMTSALMLFLLFWHYKSLSKQSPWTDHPAFKWMVLILGSYYLAYLWALEPSLHDKFTFIFTKLVIIVFVAYKLLNNEKALNWAMWGYVIGSAYIGYLATITGRNAGYRLEGIALPETGDVNPVAASLVPAGSLLLYLVWMGGRKTKLLCVLFGGLIANALVLFNSRGAFLGTLASAGMYLLFMIFSRYRKKGQRAMAIGIAILGISGALYVTDNLFWQRMSTLEDLEQRDSGSGRIKFWGAALDMMIENPEGLGVRGFNALAPYYLTDQERGGTYFRSVHSLWFQGLTEIGWHGLIFFLLMLYSVFRISRRARKRVLEQGEQTTYFKLLALECALFGYLVTGSFINQFRADILYWMILLVAVGGKVYYLQPIAKEAEENNKKMPTKRHAKTVQPSESHIP